MIDLNQLKNTEVSSPSDGEVLRYRGGKLRNEELRELWEDVDVLSEMEVNPYYIAGGTGLWAGSATTYHRIISVKDIRKVTITAKTSRSARYAFLRTYTAPSDADIDTAPDYVSGYTTVKEIPTGETKSVVVPADANYLYVQQSTSNYNNTPDYVKFTGIGITEHTGDGSGFVKDDGSVDNSEYLTSDDVSAVAMSGNYDDLENKPNIPSVISDLNNDSGFITVNDVPKEVFVCNYTSSTSTMNKTPTAIVDAKNANKVVMCVMGNAMFYCIYASTLWILFTRANKESTVSASDIQLEYIQWTSSSNAWSHGVINLQKKLIDNGAGQNLKTINGNSVLGSGNLTIDVGDVNVQSDWNQTNNSADDFIKNKPAIPSKTSDLTNDSGFITDSDVVLVCTYNPTTRTMDKSPSDIVNAYNNGKIIIATNGDLRYYCYAAKSNLIMFRTLLGGVGGSPSTGEATIGVFGTRLICYIGDAWYHSGQYILQEQLSSGINIKTINGNSLLGSGDLTVGGGDANVQSDWNQTNSTADDYIKNKPTIPADKLFMCQFAEGIGLLNGVTPSDIYEANSLGKTVVCHLIFGNFDIITTLTSITEGLKFVGITEDPYGRTICYKLKYDTTEQEWAVTTINISSFLTAGDISTIRYANATTSNGNIIVTEATTYPLRVNDVLYLVKFIDALPTTYSGGMHFHMNNPVDYPDVAYQGSYLQYGTDIIKQGDTCMFSFRNGVMTLLYNSRWGKMLSDSVTIHSGSSAPSSSIGRDGDIYIMTTT